MADTDYQARATGMPVFFTEAGFGGSMPVKVVNRSQGGSIPIGVYTGAVGGAIPVYESTAGGAMPVYIIGPGSTTPIDPTPPIEPSANLLGSFDFTEPGDVDSFERAQEAGYTGSGETAFQREVDVDVLRDGHYQGGVGPCVILEDDPTEIALVAPANIEVTPGEGIFSATWDNLPVMANVDHWEWRLDDTGAWTTAASNSLTDQAAAAGTHVLNVRAVSDISGTAGATGDSEEFEVDEPPDVGTWFYSIATGLLDNSSAGSNTVARVMRVEFPEGVINKLSIYSDGSSGGNIQMALYDDSNNLLVDGVATCPTTGSGVDIEVAITPTALAFGVYRVAWIPDTSSVQDFDYRAESNVGYLDSLFDNDGMSYAGFPEDPFVPAAAQAALQYRVGGKIVEALTWTDAVDFATATEDDLGFFGDATLRIPVVCGTTGDCKAIRFKVASFSFAANAKVALYDNSGNLLGEGTRTSIVRPAGYNAVVYLDTPVAVTASTTYLLAIAGSSAGIRVAKTTTGVGNSLFDFGVTYASGFPPDPYSTANNQTSVWAIGMGVE